MRKPIPKSLRDQVRKKFGGHCAYCGVKPDKLQIDHLVPVQRYQGPDFDHNDLSNLMPACFSCNNFKNVLSLDQFRESLETQARKGRQYSVNFRLAEKFGLITVHEKPIVFHFEKESP